MEQHLYKNLTNSRGIKYHYYFSPAQDYKPTLVFLHGFPSTARDWRVIVPYFKNKGYGVVAPDMLGYGGTDKPVDPALYVPSLISKDIVDILNAEKLDKVIGVGHDWGSRVLARLANYFPERFIAFAWLAVPFSPPASLEQSAAIGEYLKQRAGYDLFGYWGFFSEDDADSVIQEHMDAFVAILWPNDPSLWKERLCPAGAIRKTLLEDFSGPLPSYLAQEDKEELISTFRAGGFQAPSCWYKVMTRGLSVQDDQQIPPERAYPPTTAPAFFGAALEDRICLPVNGYAAYKADGFKNHQVTIKDYDADHWLILSKGQEISRDIEAWIEGFEPSLKANY